MYNAVEKYNREQILSGVYHTIRLLRHRETIVSTKIFVDTLQLPAIEKQLINSMAKTIEEEAGTKIKKLTDTKANHFIFELSELTNERSFQTFGRNKRKGQELIKKLKQQE